jgi:transposase
VPNDQKYFLLGFAPARYLSGVFFRTKQIKGTPLLQLVEAYRNTEGQPRQRVVASLGNATLPAGNPRHLAKAVEEQINGQNGLLDGALTEATAAWVVHVASLAKRSKGATQSVGGTVIDGVLLDEIQTEQIVELGPQLVAMKAWDALGFTPMLHNLGLNPTAIATAQVMVANRLIEPLSEWALIDWAQRTALPELLDVRLSKTTKDRLYRVSDELLKHRKPIETTLRTTTRDLFSLKRSVILYDVTNTHFEGVCAQNPKAKHGKNKQKRNDCRQVAVGMAFDENGFPLAHEVFEGNISDTKTLRRILARLALPEADLKPVVILDAGFASKENLALLRELGYSYLINITRGSRQKYADEFAASGFELLPNRAENQQVEVRKITDPEDASSVLVLCRSAQRRLKEVAMISTAEQRFLTDSGRLQARIAKGKLKCEALIERAIGALLKKHPKVARFYQLSHERGVLQVERDDGRFEAAVELCGDYVLKTDHSLTGPELWKLYMTLLRAEEGFSALKGALGLRPNFHQLEGRVEGHIFISVLAYHLLCWVGHRLTQNGDMRNWQTVRRLLRTHSLVTTRLPLEDGRVIEVRKPSRPDTEQALVYQRLGIDWKQACPARKFIMK